MSSPAVALLCTNCSATPRRSWSDRLERHGGPRASEARSRTTIATPSPRSHGDPAIVALGIDIEPATPLSAGVARLILRPEERHLDPHLAFVLKEAAYKAWSELGGGSSTTTTSRSGSTAPGSKHRCRISMLPTAVASPESRTGSSPWSSVGRTRSGDEHDGHRHGRRDSGARCSASRPVRPFDGACSACPTPAAAPGCTAPGCRTCRATWKSSPSSCPVRNPGSGEAPLDSIASIVDAVLPEVQAATDLPYAFFGHSMGALVAFELTVALEQAGGATPTALFVSSRRGPRGAPHRPPAPRPARMPNSSTRWTGSTAACPQALRNEPDLLALFLPIVAGRRATPSRPTSR